MEDLNKDATDASSAATTGTESAPTAQQEKSPVSKQAITDTTAASDTTNVSTTQRTPVPGVDPTAPKPSAKAAAVANAVAANTIKKIVQSGVVVKETTALTDDQLPEVLEAMKVGKMQTQSALSMVLKYVRDMHPLQRQNQQTIEAHQVSLLNALFTILTAEDVNFPTVYRAVIAIVKKHRNDAFHITSRNRGLNGVAVGRIDNRNMRFLTRVVDLLVVTSGLNDLAAVKQHVDMKKLMESVTNVRAAQNLTAFYSA